MLHDFNYFKGSGGKITHILARIFRVDEVCKIIPRTGDVGLHVNVSGFYNHNKVD